MFLSIFVCRSEPYIDWLLKPANQYPWHSYISVGHKRGNLSTCKVSATSNIECWMTNVIDIIMDIRILFPGSAMVASHSYWSLCFSCVYDRISSSVYIRVLTILLSIEKIIDLVVSIRSYVRVCPCSPIWTGWHIVCMSVISGCMQITTWMLPIIFNFLIIYQFWSTSQITEDCQVISSGEVVSWLLLILGTA